MKVYCFCMFICFVIFSCQSKNSNLQDKLGDTLAIYRESIPKQLNEPFKIEKPKGSNDVNYRFFIYRTFSDYYFCVNIIATNLFANDQKIVLKFKDTNSLGHEVTVPENQGAEPPTLHPCHAPAGRNRAGWSGIRVPGSPFSGRF